jgi:hypothetical protein
MQSDSYLLFDRDEVFGGSNRELLRSRKQMAQRSVLTTCFVVLHVRFLHCEYGCSLLLSPSRRGSGTRRLASRIEQYSLVAVRPHVSATGYWFGGSNNNE